MARPESGAEPDAPQARSPARWGRAGAIAGVLLVAGLFLWLTVFTWGKWGDPVVDTGREVDIAWRVSRGEVLYRDAAYNYGPLSPYVNALFLKLFGANLRAFYLSGLLAAALGLFLVVRVARIFLSLAASLALGAVFLLECAFQHYFLNGNFNFILPYSYPAVHATLAGLGAFLFLARYLERGRRRALVFAGALVGAAFLCKIEIAAAAAVTVAAMPLLLGLRGRRAPAAMARDAAAWAVPLALVVLLGFAPFVIASSFGEVVWANVLKPQLVDLRSNAFFLNLLGVSGFEENARGMLLSLGAWAAAVALAAGGTRALARGLEDRARRGALGIGVLLLAGAAAVACAALSYETEFRCLPLVLGAALLWLLARTFLGSRGANEPMQWKGAALALFALLCLTRIFLKVGTFQYGFCLALPGVIAFAAILGRYLPERLPRWLPSSPRFGAVAAGLLLLLAARNFIEESKLVYDQRNIPLETPAGTMKVTAFPFGLDLHPALEFLMEHKKEGETLAVFPEGALLNFLCGMRSPLYRTLFIPPELNAPGVEEEVIRRLEANPVDWVLLIERDVSEYGFQAFGLDYAQSLRRYIQDHYRLDFTSRTGPEAPYQGCALYRR